MVVESKRTSRIGTAASLQARSRAAGAATNNNSNDSSHVLLARGLSARSTGTNIPLSTLTQDEMERDLRHMEAFQNACTTYAQQFYVFSNRGKLQKQALESKTPMPVVSRTPLPVRIDPEEEKRLALLRQKIQTCEAQREVYEGQYLSLRAHYIFLSQELRDKREDVNIRVAFLQEHVQKRGRVVALQRVRLQVLRETLQCLLYRRNGGVPIEDAADAVADADAADVKDKDGDTTMETDGTDGGDAVPPGGGNTVDDETLADLQTVWNEIEEELKKAEEDLKSKDGPAVINWTASKMPKIPPGVPLLLSQLADQPGQAAAWNTCGSFGSKPDSMLWIHNQVPSTPPGTADGLPSLRKQVADLEDEISNEKSLSKKHQTEVIQRRYKNDELVAMMALLRTEMEAVVARHNIVLESDVAKLASERLHEEELTTGKLPKSSGSGGNDDAEATGAAADSSVPSAERLKEDDENDGDDEGGAEEDEDEDEADASRPKRGLEAETEGSTRPKRRKV